MSDESEQIQLLRLVHTEEKHPGPEKISKLEKYNRTLDYMGHADVTDALLAHDPLWNWEPLAFTEKGLPAVIHDKEGWPRGLWITLTVHGHTRLGYGTCQPGKDEAIKELIGDAIRNAAMRFGIALALWSKAGEA